LSISDRILKILPSDDASPSPKPAGKQLISLLDHYLVHIGEQGSILPKNATNERLSELANHDWKTSGFFFLTYLHPDMRSTGSQVFEQVRSPIFRPLEAHDTQPPDSDAGQCDYMEIFDALITCPDSDSEQSDGKGTINADSDISSPLHRSLSQQRQNALARQDQIKNSEGAPNMKTRKVGMNKELGVLQSDKGRASGRITQQEFGNKETKASSSQSSYGDATEERLPSLSFSKGHLDYVATLSSWKPVIDYHPAHAPATSEQTTVHDVTSVLVEDRISGHYLQLYATQDYTAYTARSDAPAPSRAVFPSKGKPNNSPSSICRCSPPSFGTNGSIPMSRYCPIHSHEEPYQTATSTLFPLQRYVPRGSTLQPVADISLIKRLSYSQSSHIADCNA